MDNGDKIKFKIGKLNKVSDGGLCRGDVGVVHSSTGYHKTTTLCSLAVDYIKDDNKVLYLSNEEVSSCVLTRISANYNQVSIYEMLSPNQIHQTFKNTQNDLHIAELITYNFDLAKYLEQLYFSPDVIMIDSYDLLSPESKDHLKTLAIETNTIIWTSKQAVRKGIAVDIVPLLFSCPELYGQSDLILEYNKPTIDNSDKINVVAINRTKVENQNFTLNVDGSKATIW